MTGRFAKPAVMKDHEQVGGRIFSVGYEGLAVPGLIDHLTWAGVTLLVDVRLNAVSRRPGFSKGRLSEALAVAGIEYRHERALGNPPENRAAFRRGDAQGEVRMREILGNGSQPVLDWLVAEARLRTVAVFCVERGANQCHRRVITDMALEADPSLEVIHIL